MAIFAFSICASYGQSKLYQVFDVDTVTNTGTVTFTLPEDIKDYGALEYHATSVDLVSGAAAGTIFYEYSLDPDGTDWYTVSTDTVTTGAATSQEYLVSEFVGRRARIRITGTGTQVTSFVVTIGFKSKE